MGMMGTATVENLDRMYQGFEVLKNQLATTLGPIFSWLEGIVLTNWKAMILAEEELVDVYLAGGKAIWRSLHLDWPSAQQCAEGLGQHEERREGFFRR